MILSNCCGFCATIILRESRSNAELIYSQFGAFHMKLDQDLVFPVKDAASADLMKLKAACLLCAGVLEERQALEIVARADRMIAACAATDMAA